MTPFYTHPILDAPSVYVCVSYIRAHNIAAYLSHFFNRPLEYEQILNAPRVEYCILCLANRYTWYIECGTKYSFSISLFLSLLAACCINVLTTVQYIYMRLKTM